uniref:Uncharacterized protein n=1 Tax=Aplanochytrium stocchinoi TaxID=215587 RepID=A0A7S3LPK5_9STRA|mmetsp:Transcript_17752/g.22647  ORF Transcript_17752/g.22647 Transcript_17752/m.22647 type:complete len:330 (+) Transcript_17752:254-1243(+)|eukprot:CAMPEP_0204869472 /NCGR_PEP_ID=MMETSP1348-20121228/29792_1 /ASSEMBLY_ACC=CAM_ASM_000700 /TAXON_ID=215587 /ORGANISM="Aplanochytrium stocchinoi, Strain GSBS06" /LENGTH=329 /DNA_ID=CAMNT_0052022843 /DNA_START=154 /DNA_END=1143 /DNA_ORIENTATION=-
MGELLASRRRGKRNRNQREVFDYEAIASLPQLSSASDCRRQREKRNRYRHEHKHERRRPVGYVRPRTTIKLKEKTKVNLERKIFAEKKSKTSNNENSEAPVVYSAPVKKSSFNQNEIPQEVKKFFPQQTKKKGRGRPRKNPVKAEIVEDSSNKKLEAPVDVYVSKHEHIKVNIKDVDLDVGKIKCIKKRGRGRPRKQSVSVTKSICSPIETELGCADFDSSSVSTTSSRKVNRQNSKPLPPWVDKKFVDKVTGSSRKIKYSRASVTSNGRDSKDVPWSSSFLDRSLDSHGNKFTSAYDAFSSDLSLFDSVGTLSTITDLEMMEWLTEVT